MRRIHEHKNANEVRSIVDQDDDRLMSVVIIGDSMLNNINPRGISKYGIVNIKHFSRSTSESMKDYINPTIRSKPDAMIIHVGTNDINLNIDKLNNLQTVVASVKKKSAQTKIIISSIIIRQDQRNVEKKINEMNKDLKVFCEENLIEFLSHEK